MSTTFLYHPKGNHIWFYCPGCKRPHCIDRDRWKFDFKTVTVSPSILCTAVGLATYRCHSFIRNGQWEYLVDCSHELAGKTVPLEPYPEEWK